MKTRQCYLFVFNGYSDWEPVLAAAALQQFTDFEVIPFSVDGKPVTSAANLRIVPQRSLSQLNPVEAELLILPGGTAWSAGRNREISPFVREMLRLEKVVAAICDATLYMASEGFLDNVKHTSNDLGLLKQFVPGYRAEVNYLQRPAVADGSVITANGTAGVAFALEIIRRFGLEKDNAQLDFWFGFFHKPEFRSLQFS